MRRFVHVAVLFLLAGRDDSLWVPWLCSSHKFREPAMRWMQAFGWFPFQKPNMSQLADFGQTLTLRPSFLRIRSGSPEKSGSSAKLGTTAKLSLWMNHKGRCYKLSCLSTFPMFALTALLDSNDKRLLIQTHLYEHRVFSHNAFCWPVYSIGVWINYIFFLKVQHGNWRTHAVGSEYDFLPPPWPLGAKAFDHALFCLCARGCFGRD